MNRTQGKTCSYIREKQNEAITETIERKKARKMKTQKTTKNQRHIPHTARRPTPRARPRQAEHGGTKKPK